MVDLLYVTRNERTFGPFSAAQLRGLAASGKLHPTDAVWRKGMKETVLASKVVNLFPAPEPGSAAAAGDFDDAEDATLAEVDAEPPAVVAPPPVVAPAKPPKPPQEKPRLRRAVALKGAILVSQDGVQVHYMKKCSECGHQDASRSTMLIGQGVVRSFFYCRKCRKNREVQIQGIMQ
jgi:hypothetical protein